MANVNRPPRKKTREPDKVDGTAGGRELNTEQLRARIPSARTVTTDSAHEPAAAPFDTDDEAAGRPAKPAAIRQALEHEGRLPAQRPGSARTVGTLAAIWIIGAVVAVAVLFWVAVS
jgi:hypothetical protein